MLLIAGGSYFLGWGPAAQAGVWGPLKALARETGARLMLRGGGHLFRTAALFKLAILHSDPALLRGVLSPAASAVSCWPVILEPARPKAQPRSRWGWGLLRGFSSPSASSAWPRA